MELSILLPAFKEEESLKTLLPALKNALSDVDYEILVVDTLEPVDNTFEACKENEVAYLKRENGNLYGDAIKTGIASAKGRFCVIMDADGSHDALSVAKMLECMRENEYDVVIGSRYIEGGTNDNGKFSHILSKSINAVYRSFELNVKDVSSSFRIYKTQMLKDLQLVSKSFDITQEIICKLKLNNPNLKIHEIPTNFTKRMHGESKRKVLPSIYCNLKALIHLKRLQNKANLEKQISQRQDEIDSLSGKAVAEESAQPPACESEASITETKPIPLGKRLAFLGLSIVCFVVFLLAGTIAYSKVIQKYEVAKYNSPIGFGITMVPDIKYSQRISIERDSESGKAKDFVKQIELYYFNLYPLRDGTLTIELYNSANNQLIKKIVFETDQLHGYDLSATYTTVIIPVNSSDYTEFEIITYTDTISTAIFFTEEVFSYKVVTVPSGIYSVAILIAILSFIGIPLLIWLLLKLRVINLKKFTLKRVCLFDIALCLVMLLVGFILFSYDDIEATAQHGYILARLITQGKAVDFYDYASVSGSQPAYGIILYLIFAIWNLPIAIIENRFSTSVFFGTFFRNMPFTMIFWNKILAMLFYFALAHIIYKIGLHLKMGKEKSKWLALAWAVFPLSFFGGFFYGQYDSIGLFFLMYAILALLKNKQLLFSLLFGISFGMKSYVVFAYIPLLLLKNKKILPIIINFAVFLSVSLLLSSIFSKSPYLYSSDSFLRQMLVTMTAQGIAGPFGTISFNLAALLFASIFAYKYNTKSLLQLDKMIIYLPFFSFAIFFCSASWSAAYWYILLTPFLLICLFQTKASILNSTLLILLVLGFCGTYICYGYVCFNENLLNFGILNQIFLNGNVHNLRLVSIFTWFDLIPKNVYPTLLVSTQVALLILCYPRNKDINYYALSLKKSLVPFSREVVWSGALLFAIIYIVPSLLFYFTV